MVPQRSEDSKIQFSLALPSPGPRFAHGSPPHPGNNSPEQASLVRVPRKPQPRGGDTKEAVATSDLSFSSHFCPVFTALWDPLSDPCLWTSHRASDSSDIHSFSFIQVTNSISITDAVLGMESVAFKEAWPLPSVSSWSGGGAAKLVATIQGDEWEEKAG